MALRNRRLKFFIDIHLESGCMFRRFGNLSSSLTCCRTSLKLCNSFLQSCNFGLMFLFQLCNFALMVFLKLSYFGLIFKALVFWKLKRKTFTFAENSWNTISKNTLWLPTLLQIVVSITQWICTHYPRLENMDRFATLKK